MRPTPQRAGSYIMHRWLISPTSLFDSADGRLPSSGSENARCLHTREHLSMPTEVPATQGSRRFAYLRTIARATLDRSIQRKGRQDMRQQRAMGQLLRSLAFMVAMPSLCLAQDGTQIRAVIQLESGKMSLTSPQAAGDTASGIFVVDPGTPKFDLTILDKLGCAGLVAVDEAGRIVTAGTRNDNSYQIRLINRGYYELRCIRKGDASTESTLSQSIGLIPPTIQKGKLGVMATPDNGKLLDTLSAQWARNFIYLHTYKMKDGETSFISPPVFANLNWCTRDHECLKVMMPTPRWLRPRDSIEVTQDAMYPPIDAEKFKALVEFAIKNDPHTTNYLEALNEPDLWWKGSDDELIQYYKLVCEAAKKARPGIKILGPSDATFKIQRLKRLIDLGLLKHIDGIAMHAYGKGAPENYMPDNLDQLDTLLSNAGKPNFPVYITEFGWSTTLGDASWQGRVTTVEQAQYITRAAALLLARHNVRAALAFTLHHYGERNVGGYSMLNYDLSPKPAYVAFSQLAWRFASVVPSSVSLQRTKDDVFMISAKMGEENLIVAWRPEGRIQIPAPCAPKEVEDMMGRTLPPIGHKSITVDESPLYLVGCRS